MNIWRLAYDIISIFNPPHHGEGPSVTHKKKNDPKPNVNEDDSVYDKFINNFIKENNREKAFPKEIRTVYNPYRNDTTYAFTSMIVGINPLCDAIRVGSVDHELNYFSPVACCNRIVNHAQTRIWFPSTDPHNYYARYDSFPRKFHIFLDAYILDRDDVYKEFLRSIDRLISDICISKCNEPHQEGDKPYPKETRIGAIHKVIFHAPKDEEWFDRVKTDILRQVEKYKAFSIWNDNIIRFEDSYPVVFAQKCGYYNSSKMYVIVMYHKNLDGYYRHGLWGLNNNILKPDERFVQFIRGSRHHIEPIINYHVYDKEMGFIRYKNPRFKWIMCYSQKLEQIFENICAKYRIMNFNPNKLSDRRIEAVIRFTEIVNDQNNDTINRLYEKLEEEVRYWMRNCPSAFTFEDSFKGSRYQRVYTIDKSKVGMLFRNGEYNTIEASLLSPVITVLGPIE